MDEHKKLDRIIERMKLSESKELVHTFLTKELERIANENPEMLIICNCHGEYWPSKCVDVWGNCHPEWEK